MSFENSTGLGVFSSYGKRDTGGTVGCETSDGSTRDYSITFTGESLNSGSYRDWETDRKSTRLNSSHSAKSRMPSSA